MSPQLFVFFFVFDFLFCLCSQMAAFPNIDELRESISQNEEFNLEECPKAFEFFFTVIILLLNSELVQKFLDTFRGNCLIYNGQCKGICPPPFILFLFDY